MWLPRRTPHSHLGPALCLQKSESFKLFLHVLLGGRAGEGLKLSLMGLRDVSCSYTPFPSPIPRTSHFSCFFLLILSGKLNFCFGEPKRGKKCS